MFVHFVVWLSRHIGPSWVDVLVCWFGLHLAYVVTMKAQDMRDRGMLFPYWIVHLGPLAIVGLVLDVVFNATAATVLYLELPHWPRELMFTVRTRRNAGDPLPGRLHGWRRRMGQWWKRQLNAVQPGHV